VLQQHEGLGRAGWGAVGIWGHVLPLAAWLLPAASKAPLQTQLFLAFPSPPLHPTPHSTFCGNTTFVYRIVDSTAPGATATATVTLVVTCPPATPPVAVDDVYSCPYGAPCSPPASPAGGILANDRSPTGGTLAVEAIVTQPAVGTLTFTSTGSFEFTPPR
jgi:hypothetical protein